MLVGLDNINFSKLNESFVSYISSIVYRHLYKNLIAFVRIYIYNTSKLLRLPTGTSGFSRKTAVSLYNTYVFLHVPFQQIICNNYVINVFMKNIRDTCIDFFQNDDIRKDVRDILKPIAQNIYNELYIYIWFICFYHVILIFIILVNLFLLLRLFKLNVYRTVS